MKMPHLIGLLILTAILSRLIPHPANVTPVSALALLWVCYANEQKLRWGLLLPLLAILVSDFVLGFYPGIEYVYLGHAVAAALGLSLRNWNWTKLIGVSLSSSLIFFAISNFGVWLSVGLYPKNSDGLMACYIAGIPFLRNAMIGDLIFCVAIFSAVRVVSVQVQKRIAV